MPLTAMTSVTLAAALAVPAAADWRAAIEAAAPEAAPVPAQAERKVLVFTGSRGFVHSSIPHGAHAVEAIGTKTGAWTATVTDEISHFQPGTIENYDAIVLMNTTGPLFLPANLNDLSAEQRATARARDEQLKASLRNWLLSGGGLVGFHAAADCFYEWPEYGEMIGAYFDNHPWHEEVSITVDDPSHPITAGLDDSFLLVEEIYQFRAPFTPHASRVLMRLDTERTDMEKEGVHRLDGEFPLAWIHRFGEGRVFYTALGHGEEIFANPSLLAHFAAGIQYALGDLQADDSPASPRGTFPSVSIYDGRTLLDWEVEYPTEGAMWTIIRGEISGTGHARLVYDRPLRHFRIGLGYTISPGSDAELRFESVEGADQSVSVRLAGHEAINTQTTELSGTINGVLPPARRVERPAGQRNQIVLTMIDGTATVDLNGAQVAILESAGASEGRFVLQSNSGTVRFDAIRLMEFSE